MKQRFVMISALVIIAVLAIVIFVYAFTAVGRPAGTCPPILLGSGYPSEGPTPFSVEAVGEQSEVISGSGQIHGVSGSGTIAWCFYGSFGVLENSLLTNRLIGQVSSSADEEEVAVAGYQIAPGPAGMYTNGGVYLFGKEGQMKWNLLTSEPVFSVHINSNGSVIVTDGPDLLYIGGGGRVLWNYSEHESMATVLVDDGSTVLAGVNGVTFPNDLNYGSVLTMFDSHGNVLWNASIPDETFDSSNSLAASGGLIVAGVSVSGYNGTLSCYNMQGVLLWSRHIDSAIFKVSFENNGSSILAETNWGHVTFDPTGKVIENQTSPH
ncbi:MAG: PQQ-binding-like beta-propeller repeat protein [Nitrososphaerales archaeon]|jgi:hypothetical protein